MTENKKITCECGVKFPIKKISTDCHCCIKVTLKCHRCKYIWETKSEKKFVSCPDCLTKVKVEEYKA